MPQLRTVLVLASLVSGMTVISGLFLWLEPGPVAPVSGITLQSVDREVKPEQRLFETASPHGWQAIVIHDSRTLEGSSRLLNEVHEQAGRGGLGYHFVINNGSVEADGTIEIGFRWRRQFSGSYVDGQGSDWFNENAIGVCLIGDAERERFTDAQLRELIWLVTRLQQRFEIPADAVYLQLGGSGESPTRLFPTTWFRRQLFTESGE